MNMSQTARKSDSIRLSGSWLLLFRVSWVILSLAAFSIFALFTIKDFTGFSQPCFEQPVQDQAACMKTQQELSQLGLAMNFYAVFIPAGLVVELLPWFIAGALIFLRKSTELFEALFSLLLMIWGIIVIDSVISNWFSKIYPSAAWLISLLGLLANSLLVLWLLFPDGRFRPRWGRWVAALWIVRNILAFFFPGTFLDPLNWPSPIPQVITILFIAMLVYSLVYRYRRDSGAIQRQQIKWVVAGAAVYGTVWIIANNFFPFGLSVELARLIWLPFNYGASAFFAAALVFSILRYRLWDIDVIIRRTLVYGLLTAVLALVFFGGVTLLQAIFSTISNRKSEISIVLSTLVLAALFNPLRRGIQNGIDRRFYRKKYDAQRALEGFAQSARSATDLDALTVELERVVQETIQPARVGLWLKPNKKP
jgi:hypothetical protein